MEIAPLNHNVAESPLNGEAYWIEAKDCVRLRIGVWRSIKDANGTILLFPGRTEYIEKYGRTITDLVERGFDVLVIDWRGQGLSDRLTDDPMVGHVAQFSDYQRDVSAMVRAAHQLGLRKPWNLLGHSMGACIGLRAVAKGLSVSTCAFTGPMWDIKLHPMKRAFAGPAARIANALGKGHSYASGTIGESYVLSTAFGENRLTNDPDFYRYFIHQARLLTEHQIGGPSWNWLLETLCETKHIAKVQTPDIHCITFVGEKDEVVDSRAIRRLMARWPNGRLEVLEHAKHDLLSETTQIREHVVARTCELFLRPE